MEKENIVAIKRLQRKAWPKERPNYLRFEISDLRKMKLYKKNKTPVISRSFNHQSKNEQLIRLLLR